MMMKHLVVQSDLRGAEIRPPALLAEWLRLAEAASEALRSRTDGLIAVACPACESSAGTVAFERLGFAYKRCATCDSLYVALRPSAEALATHYRDSPAAAFRIAFFGEQTASARFRHVVQSRVEWIGQVLMREVGAGRVAYADVGTLYPGIFAELRDSGDFDVLASLECDARIAERLPEFVRTDAAGLKFQMISAFEQLEHQFDPFSQLLRLKERLSDDGTLLLTTRSSSGFDLSILGGRASYLLVPEHLNLLSLDGIETLMRRAGFDLLELSTPGELDVGLVQDAITQDPTIPLPAFVHTLLHHRSAYAHRDFQEFLQKHRLSSHVRIAARPA